MFEGRWLLFSWYQSSMSDIYCQVEKMEKVGSHYWHEYVGDQEFPNVAVGLVVDGEFLVSVGLDCGTVGCSHDQ